MSLATLPYDLIDLVFPRICASCDLNTALRGDIFCAECHVKLPLTNYHLHPGNPFERHFWGRVGISAGAAFLFFIPGGTTQSLLHNIKYKGQKSHAVAVGNLYGKQLVQSERFQCIDAIIPVPLHWKKLRIRGFNQSSAFAAGLAELTGAPVLDNSLTRMRHTTTQTFKNRMERLENMRDAFSLNQPGKLEGKHILLVDDVLTTGATLEACAQRLHMLDGVQISMLTIACGRI